jgi:anti-sigma factor RsiW
MAEKCSWTDRVITAGDSIDGEMLRHLESCSVCRAERFAQDELVAAFRGAARPALSPHFRSQLMGRITEERRRKRSMRRHLALLRLYWIFAAIVCGAVIINLTWVSPAALQSAPTLLAVALFALPICLVLIAIRVNPVELVFHALIGTADRSLPGSQWTDRDSAHFSRS